MNTTTEIFVFGSNTEGRHSKGAALEARLKHGAVYGQAKGRQGNSYAIVTKDLSIGKRSVALTQIYVDVQDFLYYAQEHPELIFNVTPIGRGLGGYTPTDIAPMFLCATSNVKLPKEFLDVLPSKY